MAYLGDFTTANTVYVYFDTHVASTGASVTMTGLAVTDVEIYKDGGITQRSSDAGITLLDTDGIDFDSITGIHGFKIDLSDNTDAGFYAAGSEYAVVVSAVTVDSQAVNFVAAEFSIERAGGALALLKNETYGLSAIQTETSSAKGVTDSLGTMLDGGGDFPWAWDSDSFANMPAPDNIRAYVTGFKGGGGSTYLGVLESVLPASVTGDSTFVDATWNGLGNDFCVGYVLMTVNGLRVYTVTDFDDATDTVTIDGVFAAVDEESKYMLVPWGPSGGGGASAADIWANETRTLTALDEDDTDIDLDGTTIGTVTTVTNGVTLADDAITASKFDQSTAHPQTVADSSAMVLP